MRLKRVFPKIEASQIRRIDLAATPENSHDLAWFCDRYPLRMKKATRLALEERSGAYIAQVERTHKILQGYVPPIGEMELPPREYQAIAAALVLNNGNLLLADELGLGKEQPVDTKVLTPDGWRQIGDLSIDDLVIGSDGAPTKVTGIYPQGVKPSYTLHFNDGSSVEAGDNHLWKVRYKCGGRRDLDITVTTKQLRTGATIEMHWDNRLRPATQLVLGRTGLYLPFLSAPVEFNSSPLPISPYLMGALIANGALGGSTAIITVGTVDWPEIQASLRDEGAPVGAVRTYDTVTHVTIKTVIRTIRNMGLGVKSRHKFIPLIYLRASPEDRISLLHGLMDADGSCSATRNRVNYHTISKRLAYNVRELVECLGGMATVREYDRRHQDKPTEYQVRVRLPPSIRPFRLRRKDERYAPKKRRNPIRRFLDATYARDVESVCIAVDAPDHLYVTEHAILTHNTISALTVLSDPQTLPALVVVPAHLPQHWVDQTKKFLPHLRTHIIKTREPYDIDADLIIASYHKIASWVPTLEGVFRTIIMDECQELRRAGSLKYGACRMLAEDATCRMGLSIGPNSVLELRGGAFGHGWVGTIAEAWDFAPGELCREGAYELLELVDVLARGWDGRHFAWKPVVRFIRHAAPSSIYSVKCRGDVLGLTEDHSVFIGTAEGLKSVRGSDLREGDILPIDNGFHWTAGEEEAVDVPAVASDMERAQVVVDLSSTTASELGVESWEWRNFHREAQYGSRLPVAVFLAHRKNLPTPTRVYLAPSKRAYWIGSTIRLSTWAYLLGFFLGDGWIGDDDMRVSFAVHRSQIDHLMESLRGLPGVQLDPKLNDRGRGSVELRLSHRLFAAVLKYAVGDYPAWEKRIPGAWIVTWPRSARRELLQGLIDSDGHVNKKGYVYFSTTSRALASSLLSLLRSMGIVGSIYQRPPKPGGCVDGRQIHARRPSYVVYWSGHAMRGDNEGHRGLRNTLNGDYHEGRVRQVGCAHSRGGYVYDLEMRGHPSFCANGILVHNSATPIYNQGGEFFNVMDAMAPGCLGDRKEFVREWCHDHWRQEKVSLRDPEAFGTYLRESGLMLLRTKSEVGRELPKLNRIVHEIEADLGALEAMAGDAAELARAILSPDTTNKQRFVASGEFDAKMRQMTGVAKAPFVAEFIRMMLDQGRGPIVLFGWHRAVYELWLDRLSYFEPAMYTGSESPSKKQKEVERFIKGDTQLLIMSLRSGIGLDGLQGVCSRAVFGELDWSFGAMEQCLGRIHRDGQKQPVFAYYLTSTAGSDPTMVDALGLKRAQIEGVLDPSGELVTKLQLDPDHIKKLAKAYLEAQET